MRLALLAIVLGCTSILGCAQKNGTQKGPEVHLNEAPPTVVGASDHVQRLIAIAPPPQRPIETAGELDWASVEEQLGSALPADYKLIVETYGTGCFSRFVWVFNPFSKNTNLNLIEQGDKALRWLRNARRDFPGDLPFPVFPEPGGVLAWGGTDNGDHLLWVTHGPPETWGTVIYNVRDGEYCTVSSSVSGLLCDWLDGTARPEMFPEDSAPAAGGTPFEIRPDYGADGVPADTSGEE